MEEKTEPEVEEKSVLEMKDDDKENESNLRPFQNFNPVCIIAISIWNFILQIDKSRLTFLNIFHCSKTNQMLKKSYHRKMVMI